MLAVLKDSTALSPPDADEVLKNIVIPSCPEFLNQLRTEMARADPDSAKVARLVSADVALSIAVLRTVNAPFYGLRRKIEGIEQAVAMIGMRQVSVLVTSLLMRQALQSSGLNLVRFWDVSNKRSFGMVKIAKMAKKNRSVSPDTAQSFGLFCDIGIPLLMHRFKDYSATLKLANATLERSFTDIEREHHGADHAHIGSIMARSWGLGDTLCSAIKRHHDYNVFQDPSVQDEVSWLIAMGLVVELAIQRYSHMNASREWDKGGDQAMGVLMLSEQELEDWVEDLIADFAMEE